MTGALLLFTPSNTVNYCTITITISYSVKIHIVLRRFKKYVQKVKKSSKNFQIYRYKTLSAKKGEKRLLEKRKKNLKCNAVQRNSIQFIRYGKERWKTTRYNNRSIRYSTVRYDVIRHDTVVRYEWYGKITAFETFARKIGTHYLRSLSYRV